MCSPLEQELVLPESQQTLQFWLFRRLVLRIKRAVNLPLRSVRKSRVAFMIVLSFSACGCRALWCALDSRAAVPPEDNRKPGLDSPVYNELHLLTLLTGSRAK